MGGVIHRMKGTAMSADADITLVENLASEIAPAILVTVLSKYAPKADIPAAKTALAGVISNAIALEKAIAGKDEATDNEKSDKIIVSASGGPGAPATV